MIEPSSVNCAEGIHCPSLDIFDSLWTENKGFQHCVISPTHLARICFKFKLIKKEVIKKEHL